MKIIEGKTFSEERALYGENDCTLKKCVFRGEEDGESALKEARNIKVTDCEFYLRYPLWHVKSVIISGAFMADTCRAALWYDANVSIASSKLFGIKALRECRNVVLCDNIVDSAEFGWNTKNIVVSGGSIKSEYAFMGARNVTLENVSFGGKYSFQYVKDLTIKNSVLETKDAFWHAKNAYIENSTIKGEYLGWYSDGLTLKNCKIIGTQPLCYCKNLKLIDCVMEGCDLAFEHSDVRATVLSRIDSIKTPSKGKIVANEIGEIITDKCSVKKSKCKILQK